jgi:starch synthase
MSKKRILFVTQEMNPYTNLTRISEVVHNLPQMANEKGFEVRILMPKFGTINERRHRLHEVVRLSGMNIIVDDEDFPLIIKVASLPGARLQVYFLDNEEFFKRKKVFKDAEEELFEDNMERMVFFCKGILETVKKFGWPPDIIHCHGWMTGLIPAYLKTVYKDDPVFQNATIVNSIYEESDTDNFTDKFLEIAAINDLEREDLSDYLSGDKIDINKGSFSFSDTVVIGSESIEDSVKEWKDDSSDQKIVPFEEDISELLTQHYEFYNSIFEES